MRRITRDVVAVGAFFVSHVASVASFRYLSTKGVPHFALAMFVAVVGSGVPAVVYHDPRRPEGGEIELAFTLLAMARTFFTYYAFVFSSMGAITVGMAESVVMLALVEHFTAERRLEWRRQLSLGGIVMAMVLSGGAILAAQIVGMQGWVFAAFMGMAKALFDAMMEFAHKYGYEPMALYSRATLRSNLYVLLLALALGYEQPAEMERLDGYQWGMMLLCTLAVGVGSAVSPWISHQISPSVTDATEQLSVTVGFAVDIVAYGARYTALEAIAAAVVLITVLVFFGLEEVEQSEEIKKNERLHERWRNPLGTWPFVSRAGAALLALLVVMPALYGSALLRAAGA